MSRSKSRQNKSQISRESERRKTTFCLLWFRLIFLFHLSSHLNSKHQLKIIIIIIFVFAKAVNSSITNWIGDILGTGFMMAAYLMLLFFCVLFASAAPNEARITRFCLCQLQYEFAFSCASASIDWPTCLSMSKKSLKTIFLLGWHLLNEFARVKESHTQFVYCAWNVNYNDMPEKKTIRRQKRE